MFLQSEWVEINCFVYILADLCVHRRVSILGECLERKAPYLGLITDNRSECDQILKKLRVDFVFFKTSYYQVEYAIYINLFGIILKGPTKYQVLCSESVSKTT